MRDNCCLCSMKDISSRFVRRLIRFNEICRSYVLPFSALPDKSNFLSGHPKAGIKVKKLASIRDGAACLSTIRRHYRIKGYIVYSGQDIRPSAFHRKQHSFIFLFNLFQSVIIFRTVLVECILYKRLCVTPPTRASIFLILNISRDNESQRFTFDFAFVSLIHSGQRITLFPFLFDVLTYLQTEFCTFVIYVRLRSYPKIMFVLIGLWLK